MQPGQQRDIVLQQDVDKLFIRHKRRGLARFVDGQAVVLLALELAVNVEVKIDVLDEGQSFVGYRSVPIVCCLRSICMKASVSGCMSRWT